MQRPFCWMAGKRVGLVLQMLELLGRQLMEELHQMGTEICHPNCVEDRRRREWQVFPCQGDFTWGCRRTTYHQGKDGTIWSSFLTFTEQNPQHCLKPKPHTPQPTEHNSHFVRGWGKLYWETTRPSASHRVTLGNRHRTLLLCPALMNDAHHQLLL